MSHELDNYYSRVMCPTSIWSGSRIRRDVVWCVSRVYGVVQEFNEMSYRVSHEMEFTFTEWLVGDLVSCVPRIYGVVVGNLAICRTIVLCTRS